MTNEASASPTQPTEGYTVDQFAEDAINLIRTLDAGPAVLVGNSLGGTVAMAVAFAAPEMVRGLVICGGFGRTDRTADAAPRRCST